MGTSNNIANQVFTVMMIGLPCIYVLSWIDCAATVATTPSGSRPVSGGSISTMATPGTTAPGAFYRTGAESSPSLLGDDLGLVLLVGGALLGVLFAGGFAIWSLAAPSEPKPKPTGRKGPRGREMGELGEADSSAWYGILGSVAVVLIALFGMSLVLIR